MRNQGKMTETPERIGEEGVPRKAKASGFPWSQQELDKDRGNLYCMFSGLSWAGPMEGPQTLYISPTPNAGEGHVLRVPCLLFPSLACVLPALDLTILVAG